MVLIPPTLFELAPEVLLDEALDVDVDALPFALVPLGEGRRDDEGVVAGVLALENSIAGWTPAG